jgi:heat shock protein HtpX
MFLLVTILFAIIYACLVMIGSYLGISNFYFYLVISLAMMFIQYLIGPKIVEWTMKVKYVKREDFPKLYQMVEGLAMRANIPVPRVCVAQIPLPNAFAFGRTIRDGRVCVTQGILGLLNDEELKAVLGHELSHLKNRDVLTITLLSVIPMIMYRIAWQFLFYGRRRDSRGSNTVLIGFAAFVFYFITNPSSLASSLYKLVYGSARMSKESLKEVEGLKAFFVNDPSRALHEIKELSQLDLDRSGAIETSELELLRNKKINLGFGDRLLEILSTHPNMLKRIKQLSEYKGLSREE